MKYKVPRLFPEKLRSADIGSAFFLSGLKGTEVRKRDSYKSKFHGDWIRSMLFPAAVQRFICPVFDHMDFLHPADLVRLVVEGGIQIGSDQLMGQFRSDYS